MFGYSVVCPVLIPGEMSQLLNIVIFHRLTGCVIMPLLLGCVARDPVHGESTCAYVFLNAPSRHAGDDQNVLGSKTVLFDVVSALFLKSVMWKGETVLEFGNPCLDS